MMCSGGLGLLVFSISAVDRFLCKHSEVSLINSFYFVDSLTRTFCLLIF